MQDDQLDSYMNAAAGLLRLPLEPGWKPGVRENLVAVLSQAEFLAGFPLSAHAEPASRYELEDWN